MTMGPGGGEDGDWHAAHHEKKRNIRKKYRQHSVIDLILPRDAPRGHTLSLYVYSRKRRF